MSQSLDALTKSNLDIKVDGPYPPYSFKWRVVNAHELKRGVAIKQVQIYLYDFK